MNELQQLMTNVPLAYEVVMGLRELMHYLQDNHGDRKTWTDMRRLIQRTHPPPAEMCRFLADHGPTIFAAVQREREQFKNKGIMLAVKPCTPKP